MLVNITTTLATLEEARMVVEDCVARKLAVCGQIGAPVESFYRWKGTTEQTLEVPILLKTIPEKQPACVAHILSLHPYETPVIEWQTVNATPDSLVWATHALA